MSNGLGTPATVCGERGGACPRGSSSSDCGSFSVSSQTGGSINASALMVDVKEVEDPIGRRNSITRTPPMSRKHLTDTSEETAEVTEIGSSKTGSTVDLKGPSDECTREKELEESRKILDKLTAGSGELMKLIKSNVNTKAEIKQNVRNMHWQIEALKRRVLEWSEAPAETKKRQPIRKTSTVGTQVDMERIEEEINRNKEKIIINIKEEMDLQTGWNGLNKVLDEDWPEECFQRTKLEVGSNTAFKMNEGDAALMLSPEISLREIVSKGITKRCPGIETLVNEGLEEGRIEYVRTVTETIASKGKKIDSSKVVYVLPFNSEKTFPNKSQRLFDLVKAFKEEVSFHASKSIKIITIEETNISHFRKCLEYIFYGTEIDIQIITKTDTREGQTPETGKKTTTWRNKQTEKVIVKSGGKTYADLLRNIKQNINIDKINVKVKRIKRTEKGDVMLEVEGDKENAVTLQEAIRNGTQNMEVVLKKTEATVYISDLDADVTENDIKEAISRSIGNNTDEQIRVVGIKPTLNGSQTATVIMPQKIASDIISRGRIRIGWVSCRIRKRVNIIRCFKCLGFGHTKYECKGEDKSKHCLNCGEEGHVAKECKNQMFCTTCKVAGHKANQLKCPTFRRLVHEKEKEEKGKNTAKRKMDASAKSITTNGA